MFANNMV